MPDIRDLKIHSFSSEDPNFPARNLVESSSTTKKWKVLNLKDTSSFVILKLPEPKRISAVNIGNEGSAFIEILVADSRNAGADFKELLLATSFMRESDAMNQKNLNQVKCFPTKDLVEETAKHEWDLVKIVCKQPFNRNLKYGIAFVTLQSPAAVRPTKYDSEDEAEPKVVIAEKKKEKSEEKVKKFGRFTMRLSSSEEEEDKNSSPFSRWKNKKGDDKSSSQSSSMRRAIDEKLKDEKRDSGSKKPRKDEKKDEKPPKDRQRFSRLIYESEDDEVDAKAEERIKRDKIAAEKSSSSKSRHSSSSASSSNKPSTPKSSQDRKTDKFSSFLADDVDMPPASSSSVKKDKPKSPQKSPKVEHMSKPKKIDYKKFEKLFEGVTFAFSGYVNPERGMLRSKALEMGAKYQPDWNDKCTHLICAFTSTPKYQQVKLIPGKFIVTAKWIESCYRERKRFPWRRFALDRAARDESESENEVHELVEKEKTVEELEAEVMEIDENEPNNKVISSQRSFADISTDEDSNMSSGRIENSAFEGKSFFLNSDLSATDKLKLKDQIVSMSGKVSSSASNVDFIVASSAKHLPGSFSDKAEIIKGLWINECYELSAIIPTKRYKFDTS